MKCLIIRSLATVAGAVAVLVVSSVAGMGQDAEQRDARPSDEVRSSDEAREIHAARATEIERMNVVNREDETLGDIEGLLIDRRESRVTHVLVGEGGVLGIGEDQVAVPFRVLEFTEDKAILGMSADTFKKAPRLEKDTWKEQYDEPGYRQRVESFYGAGVERVERSGSTDRATHARDQRERTASDDRRLSPPDRAIDAGFSPVVSRDVLGKNVKNESGESLGEIEDLMIEVDDGDILYAALSFGGFAGFGDKLFAVPFQSLRPLDKDRPFVIDVEKSRLSQAPGFNQDQWPVRTDPDFIGVVYTFYGELPAWQQERRFGDIVGLTRESTKLPFELERGNEQKFRILTSRTSAAVKSTDSSRGGFAATVSETSELALRVQEVADDGGATLRVRMSKDYPTGARSRSDSSEDANREDNGSRRDETAAQEFTVKVDKNGAVEELSSSAGRADALRGDIGRATARADEDDVEKTAGKTEAEKRRTDEQGTPRTKAEATEDPFAAEHHAKAMIEYILGAGLHNKELQPGRSYNPQQMVASASNAGTEETDKTSSSGVGKATCDHASDLCKNLCSAQLRFEGTRAGNAHFTIVRGDSAGTSSERGSDSAAREGDDRPTVAESGDDRSPGRIGPDSQSQRKELGTVVYSTEDGLLEHLLVSIRAPGQGTHPDGSGGRSSDPNERQRETEKGDPAENELRDRPGDSARQVGREQDREGEGRDGEREASGGEIRSGEQFLIRIHRI